MRKKNKWRNSIIFTDLCAFVFGFIVAVIILGRESYNCQQTLKDPKHCQDICVDQLLRFENKGLITIHCQKCSTKRNNND